MEVTLCPPVEKPQITCINTDNFGSPKGSINRHGHLISGIVIHCIDADTAQMDSLACSDLKLKKYKGEHGPPHFFVSKEGNIHQYVDETDVAWGFPAQLVGTPNLTFFDWQLVRDNPNTPIDYYTISIGIEKDLFTRLNDCDCRGLNETAAYSNLVQLIAWLAQEHNIPKNINHIEFHQNIDAEAELECGDCLNAVCVVCDVSSYCQPCKHPSKTEFKLGTAKYLYGENEYGCLSKVEANLINGTPGEQGATGAPGPQGEKGDKGDKGDTGDTGPQGIQGIQGIQGNTGPQGVAGSNATANWILGNANSTVTISNADTHRVTGSDGITTTLSGKNINITPVISSTAGNALSVDINGLFVPTPTLSETQFSTTGFNSGQFSVSAGGTNGHTPNVDLKISSTVGNILNVDASGLYVPSPASVSETPFSLSGFSSTQFTTSTGGISNHTPNVEIKISPTAGNTLTSNANGLYVPTPTTFTETSFSTAGFNAGKFVVSAGGTSGHTPNVDLKISSTVGNTLSVDANGLYVPTPAAVSETPFSLTGFASTQFTTSTGGVSGHTPTVAIKISPTAGNVLTSSANGLFVPTPTLSETSFSTAGFNANKFTVSSGGVNGHTPNVDLKISSTAGNNLSVDANGLYVPTPAAVSETSFSTGGFNTNQFATSTGGVNGHTPNVTLKIDPTSPLPISSGVSGIKVSKPVPSNAALCVFPDKVVGYDSSNNEFKFDVNVFKNYTATGVDQRSVTNILNPVNGTVLYTHTLRIDNPSTCKVMKSVFTFSVQEFSVSARFQSAVNHHIYGGIRPFIQTNINGTTSAYNVIHNGTTMMSAGNLNGFTISATNQQGDIEVGGPTYPILLDIPAGGYAEVKVRVETDVPTGPADSEIGSFSTLSAIGHTTD